MDNNPSSRDTRPTGGSGKGTGPPGEGFEIANMNSTVPLDPSSPSIPTITITEGSSLKDSSNKQRFMEFMADNVEPFEDWGRGEVYSGSEDDEEWNPPAEGSDSDSDGSQIQDAFLQQPSPEKTSSLSPNYLPSNNQRHHLTTETNEHGIARRTRAHLPMNDMTLDELEGQLQPESDPDYFWTGTGDAGSTPDSGGITPQFAAHYEEERSLSEYEMRGVGSEQEEDWESSSSGSGSTPDEMPSSGLQMVDPGIPNDEIQVIMQEEYETFLTAYQTKEDLPEVADDVDFTVDPDYDANLPAEWYNLDGTIRKSEIEDLLRENQDLCLDLDENETLNQKSSSALTLSGSNKVDPVFSPNQRQMLHKQVLELFQLLVQTLLLSRHLEGFSELSSSIWQQLIAFIGASHASIANLGRLAMITPRIRTQMPPQNPQNQNFMNAGFEPSQIPSNTSYMNNRPPSGIVTVDMGPNPPAILAEQPVVLRNSNPLTTPQIGAKPTFNTVGTLLSLPHLAFIHMEALGRLQATQGILLINDYNHFLGLFGPIFNPELVPKVDKRAIMSSMSSMSSTSGQIVTMAGSTARHKWTSGEDLLLALGFELYHKNWSEIHEKLLPCKDPASISTRFKNKTSKKSKANPIKEALAESTKQLSSDERSLLTSGVAQYGQNFEMISENFLPHRKALLLSRLWQQMVNKPVSSKKSSNAAVRGSFADIRDVSENPSTQLNHQQLNHRQMNHLQPSYHHQTHLQNQQQQQGNDRESRNLLLSQRETHLMDQTGEDHRSESASSSSSEHSHPSGTQYLDPFGNETATKRSRSLSDSGSSSDDNSHGRMRRSHSHSSHSSNSSGSYDDSNIIESARNSSEEPSSCEGEFEEMSDPRPPKRRKNSSIGDKPRLEIHENSSHNYPSDWYRQPFKVSNYSEQLLEWENVWALEAAQIAVKAAGDTDWDVEVWLSPNPPNDDRFDVPYQPTAILVPNDDPVDNSMILTISAENLPSNNSMGPPLIEAEGLMECLANHSTNNNDNIVPEGENSMMGRINESSLFIPDISVDASSFRVYHASQVAMSGNSSTTTTTIHGADPSTGIDVNAASSSTNSSEPTSISSGGTSLNNSRNSQSAMSARDVESKSSADLQTSERMNIDDEHVKLSTANPTVEQQYLEQKLNQEVKHASKGSGSAAPPASMFSTGLFSVLTPEGKVYTANDIPSLASTPNSTSTTAASGNLTSSGGSNSSSKTSKKKS